MGEYEPDDSRDVTLQPSNVPGEPPRTGPREEETRKPHQQTDPARGSVKPGQAGSQTEKNLPRGSEPDTRGSSGNRI